VGDKMDVQRIKDLKDQSERMKLTLKNFKEAFQVLCDVTIEATIELNKMKEGLLRNIPDG